MVELNEEHVLDPLKLIKPVMEMSFESRDAAYSLYKAYAFAVGFSVRKVPYRYKKNTEEIIIVSDTPHCKERIGETHISSIKDGRLDIRSSTYHFDETRQKLKK